MDSSISRSMVTSSRAVGREVADLGEGVAGDAEVAAVGGGAGPVDELAACDLDVEHRAPPPAGLIGPPRSNRPPRAMAAARSACPVIVGLLPARCKARLASSDSPALDARQPCALRPQPAGGGGVPGFVRGRGRAPL